MLDRPTQVSPADASAAMLRMLSDTTVRVMRASTEQTLSVWLTLLGRPALAGSAASLGPFAAWAAWNKACAAAWPPPHAPAQSQGASNDAASAGDETPPQQPAPTPPASYRSASGHAVAQVIFKQPSGE